MEEEEDEVHKRTLPAKLTCSNGFAGLRRERQGVLLTPHVIQITEDGVHLGGRTLPVGRTRPLPISIELQIAYQGDKLVDSTALRVARRRASCNNQQWFFFFCFRLQFSLFFILWNQQIHSPMKSQVR